MACCVVQLGCVPLFVLTFSAAQAQTPDAAVKYFNQGNRKVKNRDLDGAIADYTHAIVIGSGYASTKGQGTNLSQLRFRISSGCVYYEPL